jgi:hypothetical protein
MATTTQANEDSETLNRSLQALQRDDYKTALELGH